MAAAVICDIDGTLVDTNYQHAIAWFRAFRQNEVTVPVWRIHRAIGMGGDQLVAALAGDDVEDEKGDEIRAAEGPLYMGMIEEVEAFEGASELLAELSEARPRRRALVVGQVGGGRALPRPARGARDRHGLDDLRRRRRDQARARPGRGRA